MSNKTPQTEAMLDMERDENFESHCFLDEGGCKMCGVEPGLASYIKCVPNEESRKRWIGSYEKED